MNTKRASILTALAGPLMAALAGAQTLGFETVKTIRQSDPLIITGAIGTQSTFYHSSTTAMASPFSTSLYGNLNISIYGVSMPFSFYYASDNSQFSYPQFSFNLTPTYKGWTLLLGERYMRFSPYVFALPFDGVGIEYHGRGSNRLRFGTFYGVLRRAVNDDPEDPSARHPQYRRTGWGIKLGYGSTRNYIDLFLFRAEDHRSSIDEVWYDQLNPLENLAFGANARVEMGRHLSLSANLAGSLFSTDTSAPLVGTTEAEKYKDIFDIRYTSNFSMAGDVTLNANWPHLNASLTYKNVQPDYTTLGVSYLSTNYQGLIASLSTNFNHVALTGSFSGQSDNLSGEQLYTTRAYIYNGNASLNIGRHLSMILAYNGYVQNQDDGLLQVTDSTRVHRVMSSYSIGPSYNFSMPGTNHNISLTGNYTTNTDLNPLYDEDSNIKTLAVGAGYSVSFRRTGSVLSANWSRQESDGYGARYSTDLYALTASRSFLAEKNLRTSATLSLTHNTMSEQSSNTSLGGMVSAGYTISKVHTFALSGSYNHYRNSNFVVESRNSTIESYRLSLSYNYTFQALHIGRKAADGKRKIESDWHHKNSSATAISKAVGRSERQQAAMRAMQARENANIRGANAYRRAL